MKIEISQEHADALQAAVEAGQFASVEEAVAMALDQLFLADDDLAWAKPLVDEALAELERGEGMPLDQFKEHLEARIERSKRD